MHDLDHLEACGFVNVSSDSYPIRTVTIGKYYFIIKLKLENKFFNLCSSCCGNTGRSCMADMQSCFYQVSKSWPIMAHGPLDFSGFKSRKDKVLEELLSCLHKRSYISLISVNPKWYKP